MKTLRRAALVAATMSLAVSGFTLPADAAPPGDAPVAESVAGQRPKERVAKDQNGHVLLYVHGQNEPDLRNAVKAVGGTVSAAQPGRVRAAVAEDKVDELAKQPGVREVKRPTRVLPSSVTSEGVGVSGAQAWIDTNNKGAGVKIGILDVGFAGLAAAQAAGELPSGTQLVTNGSNCLDATIDDPHGVNVAEIVHDMAPAAQLYLACVEDDMGFAPAADWLQQQGVRIISAAIAVPGAGRGDGTGPDVNSPAQVVQRSRQAGILWSAAAGNYGERHFAGQAADRTGASTWVEFNGASEVNSFSVGAGQPATVTLRWDAWPVTTKDLDLYITDQAAAPTGPNDPHVVARSTLAQRDTAGGGAPVEEATFTNDSGSGGTYYAWVKNNNAPFTTKFDLYLTKLGKTGGFQWSTPAGSIAEPASSPYVLATGATKPASGQLEPYSSHGPTVDGRTKPDITGFASVSTSASAPDLFTGTSAAAAHVAGVAALFKGANAQLDAAQLEYLLKSRAKAVSGGAPNDWGVGVLWAGSPGSAIAAQPGGYTALTNPTRILDTNTAVGGHQRRFTAGETFALTVPGAPTTATAVVLTVTAGLADGPTELRFTAGNPGAAQPIRFPVQTSRQTTLTVIVPLGGDGAVRIHNTVGTPGMTVDFAGYFSPDGVGTYTAKPGGARLLDTKNLASVKNTPLGAGEEIAVQVRGVSGVPANATTAVVNLTAGQSTAGTFISAYPQTYTPDTSSVFMNVGQRRSNIAFVRIGDDGKIRLRNSAGLTHLAVDLLGWFAPGNGALFVPSLGTSRVIDTGTGTGVPMGTLKRGATVTAQVAGTAGVPLGATGVVVTGSAADKVINTGVSFFAPETGFANAPALQVDQGKMVPATALVPLGPSGKLSASNTEGEAELTADVTGYFVGGPAAGPAGNCVNANLEPGFSSLMDGRAESSLARWGPALATQDGCEFGTLAGTAGPWNPSNLFDNDYTLKVDWKATGANSQSAVHVGLPRGPGPAAAQIAIGGASAAPTDATGAIKGIKAPIATAAKPVGEWNTFEITVAGPKVTVLLNGTKVNEYTAPTMFNRRSYVQLSGHGTGDQVKYRNLRTRSNRVSMSGLMTGVGGACLDLSGGVPTNTTVQMWTCTSSVAQQWTAGDTALHVLGQCLDVQDGATAAGSRVVAVGCAGSLTQEWQIFDDGRIFNLGSGRCLSAAGATDGAIVTIQDCNGQAQQIWKIAERAAPAGQLTDGFGSCLNVSGRVVANGATIGTTGCIASLSDTWTLSKDGSIRALGRCLDVKNGAVADGTAVWSYLCTGDAAQFWQLRPDGSVINPKSGKCLDSTQGATSVTIQTCTGSQFQTWTVVRSFPHKGRLAGVSGKCADVYYNNDANGTAINLYTCSGSTAQQVLVQNDGTIRMKSRCMDVTNGATANDTPVQLWDCNFGPSQRWFQRPDGMIENTGSGRCLGTLSGGDAEGTRLVIYDCQGVANQRWGIDFE
ncbi:ricin-type beta-trefoil lectin domain protein [Amycolatopsis orientalis]|uniref:ricin-type beta-trefoil lectin domain protein n=1 Tax=Amycolatopsis orientalis TaxID=31958 RepID=UPI0009F62171|nr:ricin-type beta-trefoil lectin domain protein [Amycolatopsis orientalis]